MSGTAVITLAHGRHEHLAAQHRALGLCPVPPDDYVVVAMDDPWIEAWQPADRPVPRVVDVPLADGRLPLAAARNLGARAALEAGADVLVFLDVDCLPGPGLVEGYRDAVATAADRVWSGPVTYLPPPPPGGYDLSDLGGADDPHPARPAPGPGTLLPQDDPDLFWSLSFAVHRRAWERVGGFCEQYTGYGGEDTDFARCVLAAGLGLGWTGGARAYHQHHPVESPPVRHLNDVLRNGSLFHQRWGTWPMQGWLREFERLGLVERAGEGWRRVRASSR